MSAHTPAPWYAGDIQTARLDKRFNGCDIEADNGACVGIAYYTAGDIDAAECRANARLIAAAPELLETLQAVYDALCISYPLHSCDMDKRANILSQARAAIAKATGGAA